MQPQPEIMGFQFHVFTKMAFLAMVAPSSLYKLKSYVNISQIHIQVFLAIWLVNRNGRVAELVVLVAICCMNFDPSSDKKYRYFGFCCNFLFHSIRYSHSFNRIFRVFILLANSIHNVKDKRK